MPFDQIQCADLSGWSGDTKSTGWAKVLGSVTNLVGRAGLTLTRSTQSTDAARPLPDKPSIAVLPFKNITGGQEEDYFCDGMVVEIATALARFPSLFVIGGGTSLAYRDRIQQGGDVSQELGVRYLLEGSVRRAGERVRIVVGLVDTDVDRQVWAQTFSGTLEDVFALQDRVANAVGAQIDQTIQAAEIRRAELRPTQDQQAYDLYLRGLHAYTTWGKKPFEDAIELFDAALARDPNYAMAAAVAGGLRSSYWANGWSDDPERTRQEGLSLARHALRASGDDPEVLAWVAITIMQLAGDVESTEAMTERALRRHPGSPISLIAGGWVYLYGGKAHLAVEHLDTAMRLDPWSPWLPILLIGKGYGLFFLRRFEDAIVPLKEAVELRDSMVTLAMPAVASAYAHLDRLTDARTAIQPIAEAATFIASWIERFRSPEQQELLRSGLSLAGVSIPARGPV
jgi:adenylate cyclase